MPLCIAKWRAEIQAHEIIAARKFHQVFTVLATDKRGPLKVTSGIAGLPDGEDVLSILFFGGMYGVRWLALFMDWLAEKEGVRVIFVDRLVLLRYQEFLLNQRKDSVRV